MNVDEVHIKMNVGEGYVSSRLVKRMNRMYVYVNAYVCRCMCLRLMLRMYVVYALEVCY